MFFTAHRHRPTRSLNNRIHTHPIRYQPHQTLNMLCVFAAEGKDSAAFKRHVGRLDDYLWVAEDGMKMQVRMIHIHTEV